MRKTFAFTCVLIFLSLTLLASSANGIPYVAKMMSFPFGDKVAHFCLLGLISFSLNHAYPSAIKSFFKIKISTISLIVLAMISLEECSQLFIANRNFELLDLCCNTAGIMAGQWVAYLIKMKIGIKIKVG